MAELSEPVSTRVHYMLALVRGLAANEGNARPGAAYVWLETHGERRHQEPPRDVDPDTHFQREVRFARQKLADAGILTSIDGMWRLADTSLGALMSADDARRIIRDNRRRREQRRQGLAGPVDGTNRETIGLARPTIGPPPTRWEGMVIREDGPASTYALRFATSDLWKIGFASNVDDRVAQVNQHVPVELFGDCWELEMRADWSCQALAYSMEQEVLRRLIDQRTMFERVRCSRKQLKLAWKLARVAVDGSSSATPPKRTRSFAA